MDNDSSQGEFQTQENFGAGVDPAAAAKKYSVWQMEYYQQYFNVNTSDVQSRIIGSMIPTLAQNYLITKIRPNPDLYGPFWVTTTLIFTIAIAGNIQSFFHHFGSKFQWETDFHKGNFSIHEFSTTPSMALYLMVYFYEVTTSAAAIFAYSWLMPSILYILMRWQKNRADYEFVEILCVYGYSLSIYIPVAILWLVNVSWIQWILVLVAVALSGSVLFTTFWPCFSEEGGSKKVKTHFTKLLK